VIVFGKSAHFKHGANASRLRARLDGGISEGKLIEKPDADVGEI